MKIFDGKLHCAKDEHPQPEPPDWMNLIAHQRGFPAEWRWYQLNVIGDFKGPKEQRGILVKGAVLPLKTRGKHTGRPNLAKATHKGELLITYADEEAAKTAWSEAMKLCARCGGSGWVLETSTLEWSCYQRCKEATRHVAAIIPVEPTTP